MTTAPLFGCVKLSELVFFLPLASQEPHSQKNVSVVVYLEPSCTSSYDMSTPIRDTPFHSVVGPGHWIKDLFLLSWDKMYFGISEVNPLFYICGFT